MINRSIDVPGKDDNRNYIYSENHYQNRAEYEYIVDTIKTESNVIDLGCGNGSLLKQLVDLKNANAIGIELSASGVESCIIKGLKVSQGRIDQKLPFDDNSFDYSICNVTIQMVMYPETLLNEMKRISKFQIISFPNFAFYKNRIELLFKGRMPNPMLFGYSWYTTGHIHQFSIKDFYKLVSDVGGLKVEKIICVKTNHSLKDFLTRTIPNLFMAIPIFLLSKKNAE